MLNTSNVTTQKSLKKERNVIQRRIKDRLKLEHNNRIQSIVDEIGEAGKAGNSKKMFAAIKNLNRKPQKEISIIDEEGKIIISKKKLLRGEQACNITKCPCSPWISMVREAQHHHHPV